MIGRTRFMAGLGVLAFGASLAASALAAQEADNGVFHYSLLQVDASNSPGPTVGRWEGDGWIGTDFDRLWWSTEGESAGDDLAAAEVQLLYGRYVRRFWDLVVGVRQDLEPTAQSYVGLGLTGLAPYWFEVSLLGFVSQRGKPSVRLEAENDLLLTQRLILQPSMHVDWLVTDDSHLDRRSGIGTIELGVRARYEIRRKFAPYLDLTWVREKEPEVPFPGEVTTEGLRLGAGLRLIY